MTTIKQLTLSVLLAVLLSGPSLASAQQLVAVITTGKLERYQQANASFEKLLRKAGMNEDQVKIFVQSPNPDPMSLANSIRKIVGVDADLIISYGAPTTIFAQEKASKIPILFADVYDPVALNIVKGLNITGAAISGVSSKTSMEKLVATFIGIKKAKKIGVIYSSAEEGSALQAKEIKDLSGKYGFTTVAIDIKGKMTAQKAAEQLETVDAVYLSESIKLAMAINSVMTYYNNKKIPVFSQIPGLAEKGAVANLEADPVEQGQLLGVHALQLLKGQSILLLPVRSANKVSLVLNQKRAQTLGLTIPTGSLGAANRVIK
jgi:putative ABC transport system substrate-binding protein